MLSRLASSLLPTRAHTLVLAVGLTSASLLHCSAAPPHSRVPAAYHGIKPSPPATPGQKHTAASITVVDSPAIRALFSIIRDKSTDTASFQRAGGRLMTILCEEALAQLPGVHASVVHTPCGQYEGLRGPPLNGVVAVSVMRAGDSMLEVLRRLEPGLLVAKFLIQRDEASPTKAARVSAVLDCTCSQRAGAQSLTGCPAAFSSPSSFFCAAHLHQDAP
jgi:hypothetical protein